MAVHRAMRSCRLADDLYLKAKYIATTESVLLRITKKNMALFLSRQTNYMSK